MTVYMYHHPTSAASIFFIEVSAKFIHESQASGCVIWVCKHHLDLMFGTWFVSVSLVDVTCITSTHVHVDRLLSDDEVRPLISEALKQTSHFPCRDWRENKSCTFLSTCTKYVNQLFSCPMRKSRLCWRQKGLIKLINKYSLKNGSAYKTVK